MSKISEITVDVNMKLGIDKETAETCLKIVELYCNNTGKKILVTSEREDGYVNEVLKYEFT